jgi:hypothetical protein
MKIAFPSCAETLIAEKIKKKSTKIVSLCPVGLQGVIDTVETEKCG